MSCRVLPELIWCKYGHPRVSAPVNDMPKTTASLPQLNEAHTRRVFTTPALQSAGCDTDPHCLNEQVTFTHGRILVQGHTWHRRDGKWADCILRYRPDRNLSGEYRRPRILYLADRDILIDDPTTKVFAPFGIAMRFGGADRFTLMDAVRRLQLTLYAA